LQYPHFYFSRTALQHSPGVHPPEPQLKQYTAKHNKKKAESREKKEKIRLDVYQVLYEVRLHLAQNNSGYESP
jgi:hypothetical protein